MLAIEVEFLTGRYVATAYNDRSSAEWPPHPSRLFSAFVATWSEDEGTEQERSALAWLERQSPPRVRASEAAERKAVSVFVPVNDDVQTVSEPEKAREKLEAAEVALAAAVDPKARAKAEKALDKAKKKLREDTKKQTASPAKVGKEDLRRAAQVLPDGRLKQPRTFPSRTPEDPTVTFVWAEDAPADIATGLSSLCGRLIRLGHSSSLVRACVRNGETERVEGEDVYVPDPSAADVLRVPDAGQHARLEANFEQHQGLEPRILPTGFARYRKGARPPEPELIRSVFGQDWIVFERIEGDRIPIRRVADVARALRGALMKHVEDPVPSELSGHDDVGRPIDSPHVAFVPLPFVASTYATGDVLGAALVLPRALSPEARRAVVRGVGKWEASQGKGDDEAPRLLMGRVGALTLRRVPYADSNRANLRPGTWSRPSEAWATATPIALDRNPGDLQDADPRRRAKAFAEAEASVATACEHIGLPRPAVVEVVRSAVLPGTDKPRNYPPFPRAKHKTRRVLVHARLFFDEPVGGPVILGAGRYFGLGLCRPLAPGRSA